MILCAWALLSLTWTASIFDGLNEAWHLILLLAVGAWRPPLRQVLIGLGGALVPTAGLMLWQVAHGQQATGLFINKNSAAELGLMVLVGCVTYRLWWAIPTAAITAFSPLSRGVLVAAAVVVAWQWPRLRLPLAFLLVGALGYLWANADSSTSERLIIWQNTIAGLTWLGRGLGSFRTLYPLHAQLGDTLASRPDHAHNDYLEIIFELGVVGAVCAAYWLTRIWREPMVLAFLVMAIFSSPLHSPATGFLFAACIGAVLRKPITDGRMDVCARGGKRELSAVGASATSVSVDPLYPARAGGCVPGDSQLQFFRSRVGMPRGRASS